MFQFSCESIVSLAHRQLRGSNETDRERLLLRNDKKRVMHPSVRQMTAANVIQGTAPQPTCRWSETRFTRDMVIATRQTSMMNEIVVRTRVNPAKINVQTPRPRFWRNAAAMAQIITRKVKLQSIGWRTSGKVRAPSSALVRSLTWLSARVNRWDLK